MSEKADLVLKGQKILMDTLSSYLIDELKAEYGSTWWTNCVYDRLYDDEKSNYPEYTSVEEAKKLLDVSLLLKAYGWNWPFLKKKLPKDFRTWVGEAQNFRNNWSHQTEDLSDSAVARGLETMSLLCQQIDVNASNEIDKLVRIVRYGSVQGSTAAKPKIIVKVKENPTPTVAGLKPWRDVMGPHRDVAEGNYRNAEFAADLSQVISGKASFEYMDPVEFFGRTYVTKGMSSLMTEVFRRVSTGAGEPVIELKTAFGGGKTHTMLALYHSLRGKTRLESVPSLRKIVENAGLSELPKASVAVIVGTALTATASKRPQDLPGATINTVWGEIAYQLAKSSGNNSLYDIIKESDKKSVNPGSEVLTQLFDECGPCLILIDELVAYGRSLRRRDDSTLPAGTFENFLSFIQSLTEAASASKHCALVVSIPESSMEIGGPTGQEVLDTINHYFGRQEAIWKPVESNEGFEVVRRRLFTSSINEVERDKTCEAFFKMYESNPTEFPVDCRQPDYLQRMKDCYPIHPMVFDTLYNDWATLEKFQRTRGVLRLMATVINNLWVNGDTSALIMPSSLPISVPAVKDELLRYLSDSWNSIVDAEVDGKNSIPTQIEKDDVRFGSSLSGRKVARTLFFGSAPSKGIQNRGVDKSEVLLGCMQPGEKMSTYNDTLTKLLAKESYLYSNARNDRFWFDLRPTLRKMMEGKANRISDDDAYAFAEKKLQEIAKGKVFKAVHVAPRQSLDIPDEQNVRLVVLSPRNAYSPKNNISNDVTDEIKTLHTTRGMGARTYKNTLVFAFADQESIPALLSEIKKYLAWKDIEKEKDSLELSKDDVSSITSNIRNTDDVIITKLNSAYHWCVNPSIDVSNPGMPVYEPKQVTITNNFVANIESMLIQEEVLIPKYAPIRLLMDLDNILWKDRDYISVKDIWKCYTSYCYLPKLLDYSVLGNAISAGLDSTDYFAVADGISASNELINLRWDGNDIFYDMSSAILVKKDVAEEILKKKKEEEEKDKPVDKPDEVKKPGVVEKPAPTSPFGGSPFGGGNRPVNNSSATEFIMSTTLDNIRATKDFTKISDEIIQQISNVDGVEYTIKIEVQAKFKKGSLSNDTMRSINENCRTMGVQVYEFEQDE